MSGFPYANGWGAPRGMPFHPRVPPFPEPGFNHGPPNFHAPNHPPQSNFHPQYHVRHPPPGPMMGFPRVPPMHPPNMPFEGPPMMQENIRPPIPLPPFHGPPCLPPVEPPFDPEEKFAIKERNLCAFLDSRRISKKKSVKNAPSTVEFRIKLKKALCLSRTLLTCKKELSLKLDCDENSWKTDMDKVGELKKELDALCCSLSSENLSALQKKIQLKARKRASKAQRKQEHSLQKAREREAMHWKIDRWLDEVKEKNLKLKRDAELKREADNILSEVRRKIHEAKRVTEFLQVLQKLRAGRQAYALQIGLELDANHAIKFADTLSSIRSCFSNQLEQYEGEERALKVMLEAEQVERREEEGRRRLEAACALLRQRQDSLLQALFGPSDVAAPGSPLFLFYQHHNSANCSIDSLVQIRKQWDAYVSEEGDPVPQKWVVPLPPSSAPWERALLGN